MTRKINLDELRKVEATSVIPLAQQSSDVVEAIIKVTSANYIPPGVRLRASISPRIFTAEFKQQDLDALEKDPKVELVSINKKLKSAK